MSPSSPLGRFTARGGAAVEAEIARIVERAGALVSANIPRALYRALILLGGYGRGEGGVERTGGVERPHNNLDLLLITSLRGSVAREALKQRMDALLGPLAAEHGVGIDTGVISELRLRAAPCRVMWFDMRFGHKTLLGDPGLVPALRRFRLEAIEPADVRDLLVNRATLLVINDGLLAGAAPRAEACRMIVKHAMKAIIGYGDACLFALGDYAASYAEKQRRMRSLRDVSPALKALYDEAIEFRFEPSYERHVSRDLGAWMDDLREELAEAHLFFEAWRLGARGLTFGDYPDRALRHALVTAARSPRGIARCARDLFARERRSPARANGLFEELALLCAGPEGRLAVALPTVLYGAGSADSRELARRALDAPGASPEALRRAYLTAWGRSGDPNASALTGQIAGAA